MRSFKRVQVSPTMLVALVAVILAGAGSATAAKLITGRDIRNGTIRSEDMSKTLRDRLGNAYIAKLGADGGLIAGRGVKSSVRSGTGDFQVVFRRSVEHCAAVATPRGTADTEVHGFVTTYTPSADTIRVVLRNPGGNQVDGAGFNLAVVC
jgi:hypothetical protein